MAASPTPKPKPKTSADAGRPPALAEPLTQALADWSARHALDASEGFIGVAFSGGADSTALLLTAQARWPGRVMAFHVHHGLQAAADDFERHAQAFCDLHRIPLHSHRIDARHAPGQSPEDAARDGRYRCLADLASNAGVAWVLLAQHADDQVETVLLALLRGAGLPGLAAMPERFERHGMRFGRPWLQVPAPDLREALIQGGHAFIDDPSNRDLRFTRNRIRRGVLRALASDFPGFRDTITRSASHVAQAQRLLDELAAQDLAHTGEPPAITSLQTLSRDRQANALRRWLRQREGVAPSAAQMNELLDQIAACRTRGHRIRIKVAAGFVVRLAERLAYTPSV